MSSDKKVSVLGAETSKYPVRLIIPEINVDAKIQYLGVNNKGEMDVPTNATDVGWFSPGTVPGENGSAVIAGHLDGKNGEVGVFSDLKKLREGDLVYVEDAKGKYFVFVVRTHKDLTPGFAAEVFTASDAAHLNLVTCDGIWDQNKNSYSKRLVVFADKTSI